jgi:hypothetical protein
MGWTTGFRLHAEATDVPPLHRAQTALRPTQTPMKWAPEALFPGVKLQGLPADHSPPSSAEIKNGGAITPLPHMSLWSGA